jgi:predicted O-methyltransferase YrrM
LAAPVKVRNDLVMPKSRSIQRTGSVALRKAAGRPARWLARRAGFELVRRQGTSAVPGGPLPGSATDSETIPLGRNEPFSTAFYDIVPRGQFDIVRRDYYSPVPDVSRLRDEVWERRSELPGVELDSCKSMDFVERELAPAIAELDVPLDDPGLPGEFFLRNNNFEAVDAELLYGVIRSMRPARVIELGSGYSTLLINMACRRNATAGVTTVHDAYDPFPREHIVGSGLLAPTRISAVSAVDVPLEAFAELQPGDVLFVDTTHTVKLASDVNFVILDVLPRLRPGVLVHFHDIFLPWEYPKAWFTKMRYFWAEQYLLQAFLAFNREFEVLVPAQVLAREHPARLRRVIPSFVEGISPGSMWLRRRID